MTTHKKGFTLIELLVVVSIISLLASLVTFSVNQANMRSREAVRRSDLHQLQTALEHYYVDHNAYPNTSGAWWGISSNGGGRTNYIPNLVPTYIGKLPLDPAGITSGWSGYLYRSDGRNFKLMAHTIGPETFPGPGQAFYDPIRPTTAIMVCSDEPACSTW